VSNVLVAIVALIITFMLASFGVYQNIEASRRTSLATTIGSKMNRLGQYNQELADEIGHNVLSAGEESSTGYAYYDTNMLSREAFGSVTFRFHANGTGYYVCATSSDVSTLTSEAMAMVARDRPGSFVSGACGESGVGVSSNIFVSMRVR
jgi:hypothetical protein